MLKEITEKWIPLVALLLLVASLFCLSTSAATTLTLLDGGLTITDSVGTGSESGGTVTITATGGSVSRTENEITIVNETGSIATLSFEYSVANADSHTLPADSGTYTAVLNKGESVSFSITSKRFKGVVTLTMSNISLVEAQKSSEVTFLFDSSLGSVTVDGESVGNEGIKNISSDGAVLVASTKTDSKFFGWVDNDGKLLSPETTYTLTPTNNMTVKAAFAKDGGTPWFAVGTKTQKSQSSGFLGLSKLYYYTVGSFTGVFDDLNAAASYAATGGKTIVLMNSGTLSAGDYTIPAGVTLLIPFDDVNTMFTTQALSEARSSSSGSAWVKPTEYRKLTLADGANLVINGAVSLSAKHVYAQGGWSGGNPTGDVSFVEMQGKSNITVNSGGALYAYGYIIGSGTVTANNGATVYEMFQIMDFRGGTQSTDMKNGVFPLCQYYVQNIEVPMTLYSGAKEYAYTTIYMSSSDFGTAINFISNSGAMFNLTSGYVTKQYDGTTDRLVIKVYGDMTVSAVKMTFGTTSIDSTSYELPINNNLTVEVCSGNIIIEQDLAFLPGSEMIIGRGATCTLGSGYNIYIYDADGWGNFAFGVSLDGKTPNVDTKFKPVLYAPGRTYDRTENDLVDASICVNGTVDASAGYVYTTEGGANVYSTGNGVVKLRAGTQTVTHQLVQNSKAYTEIKLTSAVLQNANGSDVSTSESDEITIYGYDGLKWYIPNATLNGLTVEYRLDDYLWLNAYFTLKDITVTQADVTNEVLTVNNGAELYVTGGKVYLVKKIPADQIPDDQTFIVTYDNGDAKVTAPFSANLTDLRAKDTTDEKTKTLIDKLLAYGDAAKLYFGNGKADSQLPLDLTGLPDREKAKDAETVGSGTDKLLSIKGMNVLFEERLSLMVAIQLKGNKLVTELGKANVAQIGLLVGEKNGGVLTVDNLGTYGKAYILYGNSNIIASDNVPVTEEKKPVYAAANKETTDWNSLVDDEGRTVIYLDLKSSEYTSSFELRPFVILNDGTVMYAAQYEYGLGAYIKSILSKENLAVPEGKDANAFRNLLVRTWEYALAADLCF